MTTNYCNDKSAPANKDKIMNCPICQKQLMVMDNERQTCPCQDVNDHIYLRRQDETMTSESYILHGWRIHTTALHATQKTPLTSFYRMEGTKVSNEPDFEVRLFLSFKEIKTTIAMLASFNATSPALDSYPLGNHQCPICQEQCVVNQDRELCPVSDKTDHFYSIVVLNNEEIESYYYQGFVMYAANATAELPAMTSLYRVPMGRTYHDWEPNYTKPDYEVKKYLSFKEMDETISHLNAVFKKSMN